MNRAGLCECGCGGMAPISDRNHTKYGHVKDQPKRFIRGHSMKGRTKPIAPRLERFVMRDESGCWLWQGSVGSHGYGQLSVASRPALAHRLSYEIAHGSIPAGLEVDHLCRNRRCVNPDHLEAVTPAENKRRASGTRFTPDDIRAIRQSPQSGEALARRFGTNRSHISKIRLRQVWANVS